MKKRRVERAMRVVEKKDPTTRRYKKALNKVNRAVGPPPGGLSGASRPRNDLEKMKVVPGSRGFYVGRSGRIVGKPVAHDRKIRKMKKATEEDG